ncbi:MAG: hypothetical protein HY543_09385 [Deltaproteobacteria bacterium]|nr:hypothetical protein [Deltaproteobacteria bacterium]
MSFQVRGIDGKNFTVNDANNNGIEPNEITGDSTDVDTRALLVDSLANIKGSDLGFAEGEPISLKELLKKVGNLTNLKKDDATLKQKAIEAKGKLEKVIGDKKKLETKKAELVAKKDDPKTTADEKGKIEKTIKEIDPFLEAATALTKKLVAELKEVENESAVPDKVKNYLKSLDPKTTDSAKPEKKNGKMSVETTTTMSGQGFGPGKAGTQGPGYPAPGPGVFGMPQPGGGFATAFDPNAWYQSSMFMDARLAAVDQIGAEQLKAQKMLMLFFYFARQAMSGDLGAMYQFMRFVATIITRDKAEQNVALAEKLIQLQNDSRKATDMLMKQKSYDPDDPQIGMDFQKLMERTKADQGAIATDQKLIAQMLEEMGQVSEMMTGMVKSLLDARGRELNMVAMWRA